MGGSLDITDAFFTDRNIDSIYLDGVSLTHGNPRQHIWSFAAALDRTATSQYVTAHCPCLHASAAAGQPPSFVGSDYFCDAGIEKYVSGSPRDFYPVPLWTDANCVCCTNPPWFYKQLPQPTTDNIEMRLCRSSTSSGEDVALQVMEIYIQ